MFDEDRDTTLSHPPAAFRGFGLTHVVEMPEPEVEQKQLDDLLSDAYR